MQNPNESVSNDNFKLWSYVDENTYTDWYLGAFKSCEYNFEFDSLNSVKGKKTGRDLINFKFDSDGSAYSTYATKDMPSTVNSGVAYHSQMTSLDSTCQMLLPTSTQLTEELQKVCLETTTLQKKHWL